MDNEEETSEEETVEMEIRLLGLGAVGRRAVVGCRERWKRREGERASERACLIRGKASTASKARQGES